MQPRYSKIQALGAEMYAISVDPPHVSKQFFVQGVGVTFPILSDESRQTIDAYRVLAGGITSIAIPSTFIVDKEGIIRWHHVGRTAKSSRATAATILGELEGLSEPPNTAPVIKGRISDLSVRSDQRLVFDLSPHASDAEESPGSLRWEVEPTKTEYFTAEINGHQLTITPIPGAYGRERITLSLIDSGNKMDSQSLLVRVIPVPNTPDEATLTVFEGLNLIHIPLSVNTVNGAPRTITRISDLYDVLGGAANVHWLVTSSPGAPGGDNELKPYFGGTNDSIIEAETGIFAALREPKTLQLIGTLLDAPLHLNPGWNIVGIPHYDSGVNRLSDLVESSQIKNNASQIAVFDGEKFIAHAPNDIHPSVPSDRRVQKGQAILIEMTGAATIPLPLK